MEKRKLDYLVLAPRCFGGLWRGHVEIYATCWGSDVEAETPILWPPDAKSLLIYLKRP